MFSVFHLQYVRCFCKCIYGFWLVVAAERSVQNLNCARGEECHNLGQSSFIGIPGLSPISSISDLASC